MIKNDLSSDSLIAVGFGNAGYSKDGVIVWQEKDADIEYWEDIPKVSDVEKDVKNDTNHDWRIFYDAPLYSAEYQWQKNTWVKIKEGDGFA